MWGWVLKGRFRATKEKGVDSGRIASLNGKIYHERKETKRKQTILPEGQSALTRPEVERGKMNHEVLNKERGKIQKFCSQKTSFPGCRFFLQSPCFLQDPCTPPLSPCSQPPVTPRYLPLSVL